jgi:O-acetyl-ADP-ribose deacetylase
VDQWISPAGKSLRLERGDITRAGADAIVNAANSWLAGGGGVDGAIHDAAGPSVMAELDEIRARIGHCPTGKAVLTNAGRLKAQYIIHAVGPVYRGGGEGEADLLASCYRESLHLAAERGLRSIVFPAISTGIYGYPMNEAAEIALRETMAHLAQPGSIEDIRFVLFSRHALESFRTALRLLCA